MSVGIVDRFEVIGIDDRKHSTRTGSAETGTRLGDSLYESPPVGQRCQNIRLGIPLVAACRPLMHHGEDRESPDKSLHEETKSHGAIPEWRMAGDEVHRLDQLQRKPYDIGRAMGAERHDNNEPGRQRFAPLPRQENGNAEKGVTGIKDRCHQDAGAEIRGKGWEREQAKPEHGARRRDDGAALARFAFKRETTQPDQADAVNAQAIA